MIVVADASPLNYLIQISCEGVLGRIYDLVLVPSGVFEELHRPSAPPSVLSWVSEPPDWMRVHLVKAPIDEQRGRLEAKRRGLAVTGTLGVLLAAGRRGFIDAEASFYSLVETTTFRASPGVREKYLALCRQRRRSFALTHSLPISHPVMD